MSDTYTPCGHKYDLNCPCPTCATAALQRRYDVLQAALEDFRDYGTRHDVNPTIMARTRRLFGMREGPPRTRGWYGYIKEMDADVRQRAREALEAAERLATEAGHG